MQQLGIGLIGLGRHGARYARHLLDQEVPGALLVAFTRADPEQRARSAAELGVRAEPSIEALIAARDVELVVVAAPASTHERVAEHAALARKPLLLEKPLARNRAEGERIVERMERAGAPLMVAQTLRYDPLVIALGERARTLGAIRGFRFEQRLEPRGLAWEDEPRQAGGGVLLQTGIHAVDALRMVSGAERVEVLAASLARVHFKRNEDHASLILRLSGGPLLPDGIPVEGTLAASKLGGSRHVEFALYLEEAGLEADLVGRTLTEVRGAQQSAVTIPHAPTIVAVLRAFVGWLATRSGPLPIAGRDALASLAIVDAAYQVANVLSPPAGG